MTLTSKWELTRLECYLQHKGYSNVVFMVYWRRQKNDGQHTAEVYGAQLIEFVPGAPFTPYEDLTPEKVCQWLEDAIGQNRIAELDAALDAKIAEQKNPQTTQPDLPWA